MASIFNLEIINKRKCASVDTNVILRLILRSDPEQVKKARELLLDGRRYYVDKVVIIEFVYVMEKNGYNREDIIQSLRTLLANRAIVCDKEYFEPIFDKYLTHPSLSFEDCCIEANIAEEDYPPLYTFDKKFAHQSDLAELLA